jgi:single-strand DNA-binding protein
MLIATIFKSHPPAPADSHHRRVAAARNAPEKRPQFHIINRATLIGYLGNDAEVRTGKNDQKFTTLSIATKTSYKDKESGEYISRTEWHRCIVFGKFGEFAATLKKGAHVQVEGEIRHTEYTPKKAKKPVRTDSIRVNSILKLDRAEKAAEEEQEVEQEIPSEDGAE